MTQSKKKSPENGRGKRKTGGTEHKTEVEAYAYIKKELEELGWDGRNPSSNPAGQVWTQNKCFDDDEIHRILGQDRTDFIVKVDSTNLWVIESKASRSKMDAALDEAQNYYAEKLNQSNLWRVCFASGVAGNDSEGYLIKNRYLENGKFKPILLNDKETTGLLSPDTVSRVLTSRSADLKDVVIDQAFFMKKADKINEILHMGAIAINERAKVMGALVLSTLEGDIPDLNAQPRLLVKFINDKAEYALASQGKPEFFDYVRLSLPTTLDNHVKYKKALVDTLKELYNLNIKSAMNSGTDVLGQFYEAFLKYGNWAEKMGIVLTPRHVTRFAAEILDIGLSDVVFDPTCGTGGFLVAAFDYVKSQAQKHQIDQFKKNNIYGIDQQASLAALAIVNMIFRGDGKNNIIDGDCLAKWVTGTKRDGHIGVPAKYEAKEPSKEYNVVTKVLMNPPFAIEASDLKEYKFVQRALEQIVDGGLLLSVLPMAAMFEQGEEKEWRENRLLKENTLLSVVSLPMDLFYPIAVHPIIIIVKKGLPHPVGQRVLWARAPRDGHSKFKGKRLPDSREPDDLKTLLPTVKAFIHNPTSFSVTSTPEVCRACPVDFGDPLLELVPEAYIESKPINSEEVREGIEQLVRDNVAFLIRHSKERKFLLAE